MHTNVPEGSDEQPSGLQVLKTMSSLGDVGPRNRSQALYGFAIGASENGGQPSPSMVWSCISEHLHSRRAPPVRIRVSNSCEQIRTVWFVENPSGRWHGCVSPEPSLHERAETALNDISRRAPGNGAKACGPMLCRQRPNLESCKCNGERFASSFCILKLEIGR